MWVAILNRSAREGLTDQLMEQTLADSGGRRFQEEVRASARQGIKVFKEQEESCASETVG